MAITDGSRHQLHLSLDHALGEENAAVLMEHLPPVGWADVATRRDLDHVQFMMKKDLDLLRSDLRAEMAELGAELRTEMTELRTELGTEIGRLELRMEQLFTRFLLQLLGALAGLFTLFFVLSRLL